MALSQRRRQILGRLRHRKTREREGLVLVEGTRAVSEALAAGADARFAVASPGLDTSHGGAALRLELGTRGVEIVEVQDVELAALADTEHPQGLLLVCAEPRPAAELVRSGGRYLVLDQVQDPGNVGTLVRAATAFALEGVVVLDGTADPWGAKAMRASAGMAFRIPLLRLEVATCLERLEDAGVPVLAADTVGTDVRSVERTGGWALVVANEGSGPRASLLRGAHMKVRVPMRGPAESLNAGVAGAILMYALTTEEERATG